MKPVRKPFNDFRKSGRFAMAASLLLLCSTIEANSNPFSFQEMALNGKPLADSGFVLGFSKSVLFEGDTFPLEACFHQVTSTLELCKDRRLWAYSNEKASVHIALDGEGFSTSVNTLPEYQTAKPYDRLGVFLYWGLNFTYDASFEKAGFTLLPGYLLHRYTSMNGKTDLAKAPATNSFFGVGINERETVFNDSCSDGCDVIIAVDQFTTEARLQGYVNFGVISTSRTCKSFICNENNLNDPVWGQGSEWIGNKSYLSTPGSEVRWDSSRYKGELFPLGFDGAGKGFIEYALRLQGVGSNDLNGSEARLSDPLDPFDPQNPVNSPILEIIGATADENASDTVCHEIPSADRYQVDTDGTVTDHYSGLMWQRCPQNYTLSSGVASILGDDQCIVDAAGTESADWSLSLLSASDDNLASHTDWRLPNAKELESIVDGCAPATINHLAFPTTTADNYWSSTAAEGDNAWVVNFKNGDIQPLLTNSQAHSRLVRDSNAPILEPKPALRAGFGRATEGDSGTDTLSLPIMLSHAADSAVTVNYVISSGSAEDGIDFVAHSGTVTFAAGDTESAIDVEITADLEAERHEYFRLTLSNPSDNVEMARHVGLGRIIDDDQVTIGVPRIALQLEEGDNAQPQTLDIPVILSQPLKSGSVFIDYTLRSDSAIEGSDFVMTSGTLNFNVGELEKFIPVESIGNDSWQNDRNFYAVLSNAFGATFHDGFDNAEVYVRLVDDDGVAHGTGLNDSGPPECGSDCPVLAGQDKDIGRDPTVNDDTDGIDGFAFIKLDSSGMPLANQQAFYGNDPWDCVEDQVTGLIWEVKKSSFSAVTDIRDGGSTFTWFNSSGVNTNGIVGVENAGVCDGSVDCDTEKYTAHVNTIELCGFNDWRLPGVDELSNIVYDGGVFFGPTLDTDYFPNQEIGKSNFVRATWTASPVITSDTHVYGFNSLGISQINANGSFVFPRYVRLVRGNQQR